MWQGTIVGVIICVAIIYLFRRYFRSLRSKDPCAGCSSCCDSAQRDTCSGIVDMRSAEAPGQTETHKSTGE